MKTLIVSILFISIAHASTLKSGDVLLIELNCYSCSMIASETGGPYSHSGLVFFEAGRPMVWQALGPVNRIPLDSWVAMRRKDSQVLVMRSHEIATKTHAEFTLWEKAAFKKLKEQFQGKPFDPEYLWNNFDEQGEEKLYCTEFIAKFWNLFLSNPILPSRMSFKKNKDFWLKYYKGKLPESKPGNSPNDFTRYSQFFPLGFLDL